MRCSATSETVGAAAVAGSEQSGQNPPRGVSLCVCCSSSRVALRASSEIAPGGAQIKLGLASGDDAAARESSEVSNCAMNAAQTARRIMRTLFMLMRPLRSCGQS
jgi:hypothetical protein